VEEIKEWNKRELLRIRNLTL